METVTEKESKIKLVMCCAIEKSDTMYNFKSLLVDANEAETILTPGDKWIKMDIPQLTSAQVKFRDWQKDANMVKEKYGITLPSPEATDIEAHLYVVTMYYSPESSGTIYVYADTPEMALQCAEAKHSFFNKDGKRTLRIKRINPPTVLERLETQKLLRAQAKERHDQYAREKLQELQNVMERKKQMERKYAAELQAYTEHVKYLENILAGHQEMVKQLEL